MGLANKAFRLERHRGADTMAPLVLVTGGAGFIGGHVVRQLLEGGRRVRVLDLPAALQSRRPKPQLPWASSLGQVELVPGDVRDRTAVAQAVRGCAEVYHVAGNAQLWAKQRGAFQQTNVLGTRNVLEEAARAGCPRILHVSSALVWQPPFPCDPYSQSKRRGERIALELARQGAAIVVVNPTLPIGPGDPTPTPPTRMLQDFAAGQHPAYLEATLNFVDVRDLAAGVIAAARHGAPGRRYLLGDTSVRLSELLSMLSRMVGRPAPRWRIPYLVALCTGLVSEWWAQVCGGPSPAATVAGVRLARRLPPEDAAAALRAFGIQPRPLEQSLADAVRDFV
jgi:dihydroflavonol-4-reductase